MHIHQAVDRSVERSRGGHNHFNRMWLRLGAVIVASVLLLVFAAQSARADAFSDISPNPQNVTWGGTQIGTLQINAYNATNANGRSGAYMSAQFNQTYMPGCNLNLQWIQAIIGGQGTIGQNLGGTIPYLDPYQRDDNLPYYYTAAENSTVGEGQLNAGAQPGSRFSDSPSQLSTNNGNSITFEAALVAVCPSDPTSLVWLGGFEWGYSISNGSSSVFGFGWNSGPGVSLNSAVNAWDGTSNYIGMTNPPNGYTGPGPGVGYQFVSAAQCPLPTCPLPPSGCFAGLGFAVGIGFTAARSIRRRHLSRAA